MSGHSFALATTFTAPNKSFYAAAADLIRAINQFLQSGAAGPNNLYNFCFTGNFPTENFNDFMASAGYLTKLTCLC